MSFVKFEVDRREYTTREPDPEDRWDHGCTDANVSIESAEKVHEDGYDVLHVDGDVEPGDTVYLVWAQYGTGDSFGRYGGQYELLMATKSKDDAKREAQRLEGIKDYSVPWNGYFEWLDFIRVEPIVVQ